MPPELCNVKQEALQLLAKEQDIAEIFNLYNDFFVNSVDDGHVGEIIDVEPVLDIHFGDNGDSGVEVEATMKYRQLTRDLGFKNELPILFNALRHTQGLNPWRQESQHLFKETDPKKQDSCILPLSLHWHQVAGVHAIIRKLFSAQPTKDVLGVLLADEVGLGKTFQIATVIAFLMELVQRQQQNAPLPPIIRALLNILLIYIF